MATSYRLCRSSTVTFCYPFFSPTHAVARLRWLPLCPLLPSGSYCRPSSVGSFVSPPSLRSALSPVFGGFLCVPSLLPAPTVARLRWVPLCPLPPSGSYCRQSSVASFVSLSLSPVRTVAHHRQLSWCPSDPHSSLYICGALEFVES